MQKITVAAKVMTSVTGDVSQIPSIPHIEGKTKIVMSRIKIPRRKAITADCFGQLIEVKYMEPATPKSLKQKLKRKDFKSTAYHIDDFKVFYKKRAVNFSSAK